jgi:predicted GIY-YIG superfamily endonuclease
VGDYENVCYLIHFDEPVGRSKAQHYLGFATDLRRRIAQHRAGKGSAITARANALGIGWRVVRVWRDADLDAEQALKAMLPKNLCPYCNVRVRRQKARLIDKGQGREAKRSGVTYP